MPTTVTGTLNAVYTTLGRAKYALKSGNLTSATPPVVPAPGVLTYITTFKVGLGGWDATLQPRTPDPDLTDLDIIVDQTRPAIDKRYPNITPALGYTNYFFSKAVMTPAIAPLIGTNVLQVVCEVAQAEYNSDGVGSPQIWEMGLFDTSGLMVVYGTFNGITKDSTKRVRLPNYLVF
jgi:hypothetical protein